jgi:hypothetical protein
MRVTSKILRTFLSAVALTTIGAGASVLAMPGTAHALYCQPITPGDCLPLGGGGPLPKVSLTYSPTFLYYWQSTTLTATYNYDVGGSGYWIGIYDLTDRTWVAECSTGTTCSAQVSDPTWPLPTSKVYQAVVGYLHSLPNSWGALVSSPQTGVYWTTPTVFA